MTLRRNKQGRRSLLRLWLFPLILVLCSTSARAEAILNYEVDLVATAEGGLIVKEHIDYDFGTLSRHGIYRDIPNTVPAAWGGRRTMHFHNVSIQQDGRTAQWKESSVSGDAGPMVRYRIGDPNRTISGQHSYDISYWVDDALLPTGERDAFRWNAIGTGWKIPIKRATVWLALPDELKGRSDLNYDFFTGIWGSKHRNAYADWNGTEGTLSVTTSGTLAPHEGLTVEVSFPAGAIAATAHPSAGGMFAMTLTRMWAWPLMLLLLGLAWWHWHQVGRDPETGPVVVRYKPPKGLDAAEAGLLLDQSLDDADLTGSIVELARDGFLKIEHPEKDGIVQKLMGKGSPTLESLMPESTWAELPVYKHHLLRCLFSYEKRYTPGGTETEARVQIRNSWLDKAKNCIRDAAVEHRLFPEKPKEVRKTYLIRSALISTPVLLLAVWLSPLLQSARMDLAGLLGPIIVYPVILLRAYVLVRGRRVQQALLVIGALIVLPLIFWPIMQTFSIGLSDLLPLFADPLMPALILTLGLSFFAWQMPRRTLIGARVLRELLGFREFMRRAEAPRLRALLKEDPHYFEQTLPYAVLFGLVAEWSAHFEGLVAMPTWYEGGHITYLGRDIRSLSSTGISSSPPPSKSGGMSGGGGFSGGGGGGGSW